MAAAIPEMCFLGLRCPAASIPHRSPWSLSLIHISHVEYLLDVLLFGDTEEIASLITEHGKDVIQLEQRMAELAAADAARTKKHHERHAAATER